MDPGRANTVTIKRPETSGKRGRVKWFLAVLFGLGALAAGAWAAWSYLIPHEAEIPTVVGLHRDEAQATLEDARLHRPGSATGSTR